MNTIKYSILAILFVGMYSCSNTNNYSPNKYSIHYDGLLDTILPHFAKLHDSMDAKQKFSAAYKPYMDAHKIERKYEFLHYFEHSDGYSYFLVCRTENSIKNDKYASICGRFKRNVTGRIDSASYQELFWTWKMRRDELLKKSKTLFSQIVETGSIDQYLPEKTSEEWVEFPGNGVVYDQKTQSWLLSDKQ